MSTTSAPIGVKRIDHVTLVVKDLDASQRFYVDALGMELIDRPGFSFAGRWFQAGETQIHLILEHNESGPAGHSRGDVQPSSRHHHFAFEVEDARAAYERVQELGLPLISGPKERPDGAVQVFVSDPDGHVVELCSPPR